MSKKPKQEMPEVKKEGRENLARLNRNLLLWQIVFAIVSGLLLSAAFPPLKWGLLAWFGLIPLLLVPTPRTWCGRLAAGFAFGYAHFATCLHWLNEVGFGAGWLLAIVCALFPMTWYCLLSTLNWQLKEKKTAVFPGGGPFFFSGILQQFLYIFFAASSWVALEYLRAHICTGFPWNQLGISQFQQKALLSLAPYTGVYGISFAIIASNTIFAVEFGAQLRFFASQGKRRFPWHFLIMLGMALAICVSATIFDMPSQSSEQSNLKAVLIQGNIPQCRVWTQEQYNDALKTYLELSQEATRANEDADLLVWPECAVPAPIDYYSYRSELIHLLHTIKKPLLLGVLSSATEPDTQVEHSFNSAYFLSDSGEVVDYYNKMHLVPFGEYVPFGDKMPWLRDAIGMGRDLTAGREYKVFKLADNARAGINICFEDVFPDLSRNFTLNGANMLMSITNDSWYNESSGAEQHTSHAVFRAAENARPYLRSGNNSHSCLITPTGKIINPIQGKDGKAFARGYGSFILSLDMTPKTTFYTRHGDLFANACSILAVLLLALAFLTRLFAK